MNKIVFKKKTIFDLSDWSLNLYYSLFFEYLSNSSMSFHLIITTQEKTVLNTNLLNFSFHYNWAKMQFIKIFLTFQYELFCKLHICLFKVVIFNNLVYCLPVLFITCCLFRDHGIFIQCDFSKNVCLNVFTGFIFFIVDVFSGRFVRLVSFSNCIPLFKLLCLTLNDGIYKDYNNILARYGQQ